MFVKSYIDNAATILSQYGGEEPLAAFLKKAFAAQKKFGSRDRKQISHLCYCFYRLGKALQNIPVQERLLSGLFLCSDMHQPILEALKPQWNAAVTKSLIEKIVLLQQEHPFDVKDIFPFAPYLSAGIEEKEFVFSLLTQPYTYLRIRPGKGEKVQQQLDDAGIDFQNSSENCISVPPATKLDAWLMIDRDVVVQDKSSQQVLQTLQPFFSNEQKPFDAWDCCAASGGKSILLHDLYPTARITVSDIRNSILANLRKRFEAAGIRDYKWFVGDISDPDFHHSQTYDLIICDAPCTGSGTWSRTPEQAYFFTEEKINHYAQLQQRIALRALQQLKKGGVFLYITCSVFSLENEEVVMAIQSNSNLKLQQMRYFKGYSEKADTLFAASFVRL